MALNIVDAMGRLLRNNLGANRPMNAPAMRTSDPVPDWAKAQGVTQQMWDNMGAAEKKAMFENYNNVIRQPSNFGSPDYQFDRERHEILRSAYGRPEDQQSHRDSINIERATARDLNLGPNRPITQLTPSGVPIGDTVVAPGEITTRDIERQLNMDAVPTERVPRWASETFGITQDNWNQMRLPDKNELRRRYTLYVENQFDGVSIDDSLTSPQEIYSDMKIGEWPLRPLQPGDSGYEWDDLNDRRADPTLIKPPAQVLLPSGVSIDADQADEAIHRQKYLAGTDLYETTEEFENETASQLVTDTIPQLPPGFRQEHIDTGVDPYNEDTSLIPWDDIPPEATEDAPAATGPVPGDRFAGMSTDERMEELGISSPSKEEGGSWSIPKAGRIQMQIPEGMSDETWDKLTDPSPHAAGIPLVTQAIALLDRINSETVPEPVFLSSAEVTQARKEEETLQRQLDLMRARGATQQEIDAVEADFHTERSRSKKQKQIDEYMALDDDVRAFVEGRWRPGVENFDLAGEFADRYGGETSSLIEDTIGDTTLEATGRDDWLNPDTEETVEEEVVQASTTPALTPAQQIEQEVQASLEAGKRPPLISTIASPPEPLPKIDFSRDEVRPERIRPLTGMERFASAADSLLQRPGMAEGLTQLGTSLLQGEGLGAGLEELSGEITSADEVIREQEQLAEEEAEAQGKREAFGGLIQDIVEGPPEGVDPQEWQGGLLRQATEIGGVEAATFAEKLFPEETEPLGPDWQYEKLNDSSYLLWNKNNPTQSQIVNHRPEGATDGGGQSVNEGLARLALTNFLGLQQPDATYQNLPAAFRLAGITMNDQGVLESAGVLNKNFWKAHFADQVSGPNAMESTLIKGVIKGGMRGFIDDETGVAMQNALNAINPVVRWLSGAQMTNAEALRYYNALIPMPGEKPKTVMAKMANQLILGAAMNPNTSDEDLFALGITDTQLMHDLKGAIDRLGGENSTEAEWKELDSLLMVHMSPAGLQQQVATKIEQDVYQNYQADQAGLKDMVSGVASNIAGRLGWGG